MAQLIDFGGEANSNLVQGVGTQTAVFTMPGNVGLKVQSVVATVNNGSASGVTPKITIRDSSGVVIATNTQTDSIDSGLVGTSTFALRLATSPSGFIRFNVENLGGFLHITSPEVIFTDNTANGAFQVLFTNTGAVFTVDGADNVNITNAGAVNFTTDGFAVGPPGVGACPSDFTGQHTIQLRTGETVLVLDNSGNPIFRVDEDGDLHGLTGKALTFDL